MTDNQNVIFNCLKNEFKNDIGAAALTGCIDYMSGCDPCFGWDRYDKLTSEIDKMPFWKEFSFDKKRFGILGWKNWTRKLSLYNLSKKKGVSVRDLGYQLEFIVDEITANSYKDVYETLCNSKSIEECVKAIYSSYLDIGKKRKTDIGYDICVAIAKKLIAPGPQTMPMMKATKYVYRNWNTDHPVFIYGPKRNGIFRLFRKKLGAFHYHDQFMLTGVSEDGKEYEILYNDDIIGYVMAKNVCIRTILEDVT